MAISAGFRRSSEGRSPSAGPSWSVWATQVKGEMEMRYRMRRETYTLSIINLYNMYRIHIMYDTNIYIIICTGVYDTTIYIYSSCDARNGHLTLKS